MINKAVSSKQAKVLLRAATQLANVTGTSKSDALLTIVKSLAEYKGLTRPKG
jgi:hypothetical protein